MLSKAQAQEASWSSPSPMSPCSASPKPSRPPAGGFTAARARYRRSFKVLRLLDVGRVDARQQVREQRVVDRVELRGLRLEHEIDDESIGVDDELDHAVIG